MANKIGTRGYEPYSGPDDERLPRGMRTRWPEERRAAWVEWANEEFLVVAECDKCQKPLIAREVAAHYLTHVDSTRARQVIGMLADTTRFNDADLDEIRAYLDYRATTD